MSVVSDAPQSISASARATGAQDMSHITRRPGSCHPDGSPPPLPPSPPPMGPGAWLQVTREVLGGRVEGYSSSAPPPPVENLCSGIPCSVLGVVCTCVAGGGAVDKKKVSRAMNNLNRRTKFPLPPSLYRPPATPFLNPTYHPLFPGSSSAPSPRPQAPSPLLPHPHPP